MSTFVSPECKPPDEKHSQTFSRIDETLNSFEKIGLKDMDSVQLQNRMDTKLVFHLDLLPFILEKIKDDYQVVEINNYRLNPYQTLYFDDDNWKLYLLHHNKKMNRFKLRFRTYLSSGVSFFEIKYKNNKGRTIKERLKVSEIAHAIEGKAAELLTAITPDKAGVFNPKLWVSYFRVTFVSKSKNERVTVDLNLAFKNELKEITLSDLVIAEVKQGRASSGSPFLRIMKELGLRPGSISKYCFGVMLLYEGVKKNYFKSKLLSVNKILNQQGKNLSYGHRTV